MSRSHLKVPLGLELDDRLPESRVRALWNRVETGRSRRTVPRARAWLVAIGVASFAAALFFWVGHTLKPAALRLDAGGAVPVAIGGDLRSLLALDDGSTLDVAPGTRLEMLESTGTAFVLALRRGTTEFEVHPGGPRVWRVECAGVVVEVVGTHFTLSRTRIALRVAVERGVVLVRGDAVPDRVVRLNAGESIVVPLPDPSTALAAPAPGAEPTERATDEATAIDENPAAPAHGVAKSEPTNPNPKPNSRNGGVEASSETDVGKAPAANRAAFGAFDAGAPRDPTETALHDADALRRAGRFREAATLLETLLATRGSDARAPLVEFSLGRLYLESLGDAGVAATHFARALALHLPAALAEDAAARLVEAYARARNRAAAANAADAYRALYPNGRRAQDVERWARYGL